MSRPSDCWIHQNFILKIHKPGDAEKACNPRSLDTRDKPLDSLRTSTRYIPVPALVFAALRPSECLRVTAEKRGQLCLNGSQDPRRDKPYTGNIFGVCVCVVTSLFLHIIQVIVTTAISFDGREKRSGGVKGDSWGPPQADTGRLCCAAGSMKEACDIDLMLPRGSLPTPSSAPSLQRMRRSWPRHANSKSCCSVSTRTIFCSLSFLFFNCPLNLLQDRTLIIFIDFFFFKERGRER